MLDMDKMVIGGGFTKSFDLIEKELNDLVSKKVYNKNKKVIITKALLENNAGIIGAGMLGNIR